MLIPLFCLILASLASGQLTSTGITAALDDIYYYISPFPSGTTTVCPGVASLPAIHGFVPITVVQDNISLSHLPQLVANWTSADDVFQTGFLSAVFLHGHTSRRCASQQISWPGPLPVSGRAPLVFSLASASIPSGPYFLDIHTGALHPVYRLYDDVASAFVEAVVQTPQGTFQTLSARVPGSATLTVGVPSRLYYTRSAAQPLAGVRVGVKDIFRLAGVRGSNGNRAWYGFYPPANATGTAVQRLIDAGAVVVGLHKASQFANGETATADWVDYHAPFNPRGDGYQDPASSSSGGGAAVASYPWLDLALGSDTGGSIRGPAAVQGVFGNRPSHGLVPLDHVMPLSPALDTAGLLARDPYLWDAAQSVLYGGPDSYTSLVAAAPSAAVRYPATIYVLDYFVPIARRSAAGGIIGDFLAGLERVVNGTYVPYVLEDAWRKTGPAGLKNMTTLAQMLGTTYATLITKDQTALVRDPFYADYAAAHDGRRPFVDPVPLARWGYGDGLPDGARDAALANKTAFAAWFNAHVLVRDDADPHRCSSALAVYIGAVGGGAPRNLYRVAPTPTTATPMGFSNGRISSLAGCPDAVFPLRDEVTVVSAITGHAEQYPVAVDVLAARGCDGLLARLAQDLSAAGLVASPSAGVDRR